MTKEEGIEAIKRHLEAIENIAKALGTEDYLSLCVMGDTLSFHNGPKENHPEEERIHVCRIGGKWLALRVI